MKTITTTMDSNGRMLIPAEVREKFNIQSGDKLKLEIHEKDLRIVCVEQIIDEMHEIFTKNKINKNEHHLEEFLKNKQEEFSLEEERRHHVE